MEYMSEDDMLRVLESPAGNADTLVMRISEKADLLARLSKLSAFYSPPSASSAQKVKASEVSDKQHFTGSEQEVNLITSTAKVLHIDELLVLQLWNSYVSQLLTKPSLSSSIFTSPVTILDLCQLHFAERLRTWKLLQEMLRIDNDREHVLHRSVAGLVERLLQQGLMDNLVTEMNTLYTSHPPEFQASHVATLSLNSADVHNLKQKIHTLWTQHIRLEAEYALESLILVYYQRNSSVEVLQRCVDIAVTHKFTYPALCSGDNDTLASRWIVLFVEMFQFWRSNCMESTPTSHPLVSIDNAEKYDKIQNALHKNLTTRNIAVLPQATLLLIWGFFLHTHSSQLAAWSGQRHVGCYGQALQFHVLEYIQEVVGAISSATDAVLYALVMHELVNCIVQFVCIEKVQSKVNLSYVDTVVSMISTLYHQTPLLCDEFFAHWKSAVGGSTQVLPVCYLLRLISERSSHMPHIFFHFVECLVAHEESAAEMLLVLLSQVPLIIWLPYDAVKVEVSTGIIPSQRYFNDSAKFPSARIMLTSPLATSQFDYFLKPDMTNTAHLVSVNAETGEALLQWNKHCSWFAILLCNLQSADASQVSVGLALLRRILQHFPTESLVLLSEQYDQLQLVMFLDHIKLLDLYPVCFERNITLRNLTELVRCNVNDSTMRYILSIPRNTITLRQHLSHVAAQHLTHESSVVSRRALNLLSSLIISSAEAMEAVAVFTDKFDFNSTQWYTHLLRMCDQHCEITADIFAFFEAVLSHINNTYLNVESVLRVVDGYVSLDVLVQALRYFDCEAAEIRCMLAEYKNEKRITAADLLEFIGCARGTPHGKVQHALRQLFQQQTSPLINNCYHNVMLFCMELIASGSASHVITACELIEKHFVRVVQGDSEYCIYHESLRSSFGIFVNALLNDIRFQHAYSMHMLQLVHTALRNQASTAHTKSSLRALLQGPLVERSFALLPVNFSMLSTECDVTTSELVVQASMKLFTYVVQYLERFDAPSIEAYVLMLTQSSRSPLLLLLCYLDYPLSPVFSLRRYSPICELALNIVNNVLLYSKSSFIDILGVGNMSPVVNTLAAILTSPTESASLKLSILKHLIVVTRVDAQAMLRLCLVQNTVQNEPSIVHALDVLVQDAERLHESNPELLQACTSLVLALLQQQPVLEQIILKLCRPRLFWEGITSPLMLSVDENTNVATQCAQLLIHRDVLLLLAQERYGIFRHMNETAGQAIEKTVDAFFEKAARSHRFVIWIRQYMKLTIPEWRTGMLRGSVDVVAPLQQIPNCIGKVRVGYGDFFGIYGVDSGAASREQSLVHARLQLLQGWKRFIDIYVLPLSSSTPLTSESDVGGLSPGRYSSAGLDSPPNSPSLRKDSSFVGDKRSYELLSEIMKHIQRVCPQYDVLHPVAVPSETLSVCATVLHTYFELFVSMLHHQLKEISLRTFDPSFSEIHSRDIGNMRLTPAKMTFIIHSINDVCRNMQQLLSIDRMLPTYVHCYTSLMLLLRALANSSADRTHALPSYLCLDVYDNVSKVFMYLSQRPLQQSHMTLLQIMLRVYSLVLPHSLLHEDVADSLQWSELLNETSLKPHLVALFKQTINFDNIADMHTYSWLADASLYPSGSSTAQISITTNTALTPPPAELNMLVSLLDIFIRKPTLCYDTELLPIILQSRLLSAFQSMLHEDNNCLMPYHARNGELAVSFLCVKKVIQYVATLIPALAEVNKLEMHAHFILQFSQIYSHLLYTFLPNGKSRISSLQLDMTKEILYLFVVLHRYIPSWRIQHANQHAKIVLLLSYISFLAGGDDEHYAIAHQRILHGASIAISQNEKYEEKSLTTRPTKTRKVETPDRSLVKVSLPLERTTSGTFSDTWKQLFRQGTDESSSIKHSMKFLDEMVHRIVRCLHPLLLCIHDITPPAETFMRAEHLVVGTEVYVNLQEDVLRGQIIATRDNCFDVQFANGLIEHGLHVHQVAFTTPPLFDFGSKYDLPFAVEQFMQRSLHHPTTAHLVQLLQFVKRWHEENRQYVMRRPESFRDIDMIVSELVYICSLTVAHHSVTNCDIQLLLDQMHTIVKLIEPLEHDAVHWLVTEEWDSIRHWVLRIIEFIHSMTSENRSWTYALVETEKQSAKRGRGGGLREGVAFIEI